MGIARTILKWTDKQAEESVLEDGTTNVGKAALSGFVEGAVDGCIIWYPILLGAAYYWKKQALKK